jgi:hypothetical protein
MNRSNDDYRYSDDVRHGHGEYSANRNRPVSTSRVSQADLAAYSSANYIGGGKRSGGRSRDKKRLYIIIIGVVAVLLVALVAAAFAAVGSAKEMKSQATQVLQDVKSIQTAIGENDYAAAAQSAQQASELTGSIAGELSSPLWMAASIIPVYGQDISGMRDLMTALDDAFDEGLVPLTKTLEANPPDSLISADRRINVAAVTQLLDAVQDAAPSMQKCADVAESLPEMHIEQLKSVVDPAKEKLTIINATFQKAAALAPVAGPVLGANGNRTYLIVAQNSAELRSSGGFPGSMGTLEIRDGEIILNDFSKVYDVLTDTNPSSVSITDEEYALFGAASMDCPRDAGIDPDFTRVASIWAASYEERNVAHLDGVISITPSVVQDILAIVGPVTLSDGTELTGSNATKVLQSDIYWKYLAEGADPDGTGGAVTDALFAQAAHETFNKLFSNLNADTLIKFASCMAKDMEDRTVMFWLTDEGEQAILASLDCSGALNDDPMRPELGVFFSLWVGSKMGWYVDIDNQVLESKKNADGSYTYKMQTTFTDTVSSEEIASGGEYIIGDIYDYEYGILYPCLYIYAPAGGNISNLESNSSVAFEEARHDGLQAFKAWRTVLRPDQPIVCTYTVTTAPSAEQEMKIVCTPTLTEYRAG